MFRKLSIACVIAGAASLAAAGASAQAVSQRSHTKANLTSWTGDSSTLAAMINQIEATTGGRVVDIQFTTRDGAPGYRTVVAKDGAVTVLRATARNGETVETSSGVVPDWMLKWKARADVGQALKAKVPLLEAIRTAEEQGGGPAVAAGIANTASNPSSEVQAYNVLIWRAGVVRRFAVDDKSGLIIANPEALADRG